MTRVLRHIRSDAYGRFVCSAEDRLMRPRALFVVCCVLASLMPLSAARAEKVVTITGGGWGHGIGMSQYGAYGRAKNGRNANQILRTYYTGTSVDKAKMPARLRVGLLPVYGSSYSASISFGATGKLAVKEKGGSFFASGGAKADWRAEAAASGGFRIYKNGNQVRADGRGVFGNADKPLILQFARFGSRLTVKGKAYSYAYGVAELSTFSSSSCSGGKCARLTLGLPMQKYLYGLGEMPSSWPSAALKAQAIAGRTYALEKVRRMGQNRHPCACAVFDTVADQAYIGDAKRSGSGEYWPKWKGAVDDTKDRVVLYKGAPIQALYSSSSGGHTENNELVWGGAPIPYLRGVKDAADRAGGTNPNFKWSVTMSWSEVQSRFNSAFGTGTLNSLSLLKPFGVSGRVTIARQNGTGGVKIVGSSKTVHVSGWDVRQALGLKDTLFRVSIEHGVGSEFQAKYDRLNGAPGAPKSGVYKVPRKVTPKLGKAQNFEKGRMTYHAGLNKVVWQWGPVFKKYNKMGRERSKLRMPKSDIYGSPHRGASFDRGRIFWSPDTGAHAVIQAFEKGFLRTGGVKGKLGLPIGPRRARSGWPDNGASQRFLRGSLYKKKSAGKAFALWGRVDRRYRNIGEAQSACGYPTADAEASDGVITATFQRGTITAGPDGVKVVCGN